MLVWEYKTPTLEELAKRQWWLAENVAYVLRYKEVVKRALVNAVERERSCVVRYRYVYEEVLKAPELGADAEEFERLLYPVLNSVKIDEIVVYRIFQDMRDDMDDVLVVLSGAELDRGQVEALRGVASLLRGRLYGIRRRGVYAVLQNLVCRWARCRHCWRR